MAWRRGPRRRSARSARTRVLFVHSATQPPLGADTWVHAQIMRALDRRRVEVIAACAPGPAGDPTPTQRLLSEIPDLELRPISLGVERFDRTWRGRLRAVTSLVPAFGSLLALARLARRRQVDVLHTSDRPRDALACVLLARMTGARCVIHVHVAYGEWMSPVLKWSLRRADALVAISAYVARSLTGSGHDEQRVFVVLNAIDPDAWPPGARREATRQALSLES